MATFTGANIDLSSFGTPGVAPEYKLGTKMDTNARDDEEVDKVLEALDYLASRVHATFMPGPRRTIIVSILETDEGVTIAGMPLF